MNSARLKNLSLKYQKNIKLAHLGCKNKGIRKYKFFLAHVNIFFSGFVLSKNGNIDFLV